MQALKQQLSPVQQYVQAQLGKLRSGSLAEKAEALKGLGKQLPGFLADVMGETRQAGVVKTWRLLHALKFSSSLSCTQHKHAVARQAPTVLE